MSWLSPCVRGVVKGMASSGTPPSTPTAPRSRAPVVELEPGAACHSLGHSKVSGIPSLATLPTMDELPGFPTDCRQTREHSDDNADWTTESGDLAADRSFESGVSPVSLSEEIDARIQEATSSVRPFADSDLELVRTLQEAPRNQGRVDLMRVTSTGRFVAVKRMPNSWVRSGPEDFAKHAGGSLELPWFDIGLTRYLHKQAFQHVCEPFGIFRDQEFTYVSSEFCPGGDLFGLMDSNPAPGKARENVIRPVMLQVFSAVRWMHSHGVAHCDISLENILLGGEDESEVKLIDFGMSTLSRTCVEGCGKRSYIAPEILTGSYDPFDTDAFALGVVLFSVAARAYPWNSTRPGSCKLFDFISKHGLRNFCERRKVWKGNGETLSQVFSDPLMSLAEGLLSMEPAGRTMICGECYPEDTGRSTVWDAEWLRMPSV